MMDGSNSSRHTGKDFVIHFSYIFMHSRPVVRVNSTTPTNGETDPLANRVLAS